MPGVIAVVSGRELAEVCTPWIGVLGHFKGLRSAPQHALAIDRVTWVGEPFCAVVARSRAEAEDALARTPCCHLRRVHRRVRAAGQAV